MMLCVPDYAVVYKGTMYDAGSQFYIEDADEHEMASHGRIINNRAAELSAAHVEKKPGRPKKKE